MAKPWLHGSKSPISTMELIRSQINSAYLWRFHFAGEKWNILQLPISIVMKPQYTHMWMHMFKFIMKMAATNYRIFGNGSYVVVPFLLDTSMRKINTICNQLIAGNPLQFVWFSVECTTVDSAWKKINLNFVFPQRSFLRDFQTNTDWIRKL